MRPMKEPNEQSQFQAIWNAGGIAAHGKARQAGGYSRETTFKNQPSREICSSVTTRSTFSDLLLMR